MKTSWGRVAFVAVRVTLLSLAAAELFLRFYRPVEFRLRERQPQGGGPSVFRRSTTPGLLFDMAPNVPRKVVAAAWVTTNSYGMRDDEPAPKEANRFRIVALGDSFTFGLGVEMERAFPQVLERRLNERDASNGGTYEVLNFAVPGYSTREEVVVLKEKAAAWHPRIVIVGYCLNDPEIEPLQPLHLAFTPQLWWEHSHVFRLFNLLYMNTKVRVAAGGDYYRFLHLPNRAPWQSVLAGLHDLKTLAVSRGTPVLLVIFPMIEVDSWQDYPYLPLHDQVSAAARAQGIDVLDLYETYAQHEIAAIRVTPRDHHPSVLGHELTAEAIERHLRARGWLAAAPAAPGAAPDRRPAGP